MQAHSATASNRLTRLGTQPFDLLVIGGGITGCGIARDAVLRGLRVALVEKDDFASGTSSRSSRLVHGGVRYLEHGHLHLVFEASAERRRLLRVAPHLVHPLEFTWPVYEGARIPRWKLGAGLMLYDALALFRNVGRHHRLNASQVMAREPMLARQGLRGGATYFDARTNDARLTLTNAIDASELGAVLVTHARAELLVEGGRVRGARVTDMLGADMADVRATVVVDATGPWSGEVRGSKGAHIAVPRDRVGNNEALTLLSPRDGRVLFVLPAGENAIIGTTEGYTASAPDDVRASNEDVRYLLDSANAFFPAAALSDSDVIAAWAGIRPLVPAQGNTPGSASREHTIIEETNGVVTIAGGKLTTYRVMAAQVVDVVMERLRRGSHGDVTADRPLPGGDFDSIETLAATIARETNDVEISAHLANTHGSRWRDVWHEVAAENGSERVEPGLPYTFGELRYSARHEMAFTLSDLLVRRTHIAFETRDHGTVMAPRVASAIAPILGWDRDAQVRAVDAYIADVARLFSIDG